jgi:hypothetical protein
LEPKIGFACNPLKHTILSRKCSYHQHIRRMVVIESLSASISTTYVRSNHTANQFRLARAQAERSCHLPVAFQLCPVPYTFIVVLTSVCRINLRWIPTGVPTASSQLRRVWRNVCELIGSIPAFTVDRTAKMKTKQLSTNRIRCQRTPVGEKDPRTFEYDSR